MTLSPENQTTPTTDDVRKAYVQHFGPAAAAEFDRWLAARDAEVLAPAPCVMTHTPPMDFAECQTHDTTFPLGGTCKFDGRDPFEVLYEMVDDRNDRAVRAEMDADRANDLIAEFRKREESQDRIRERLTRELDAAQRDLAHFPCDGGCNNVDGPAEHCSRHGRTPAQLWKIIGEIQAAATRVREAHPRGQVHLAPGEGMVTTEDDIVEDGCQSCATDWPCPTITALDGEHA